MPETDSAILMEILQRITKLETKIDSLVDTDRVANEAHTAATEAYASAKSAHHRLDAMAGVKETAEDGVRKATQALDQLKARDDDMKWFKRTFYGAVIVAIAGSLVTVAVTVFKLGGIH
ncbi:hemolysin XhlA [compost metagenome]